MRDFHFEKKDDCTLIRMELYLNVSDGDILVFTSFTLEFLAFLLN